ncbi:hypothetical protein FOCC_FOCC006871 [Frankliniella occidentalis]|nr:hypothetical protein FOCC_FOCC006871 [Frankliniella occidentalis]
MAAGPGVVQRVRDVRRAGLLGVHPAHVLHLPGSLLGHPQPPQDAARLLHQAPRRLQDRPRLGARHARLELHHRAGHRQPAQHHAQGRRVRDQQPRLLRVRLARGLLHPHGHHGGHVRADGAAAAQEGALRRRAPRVGPVGPAGRALRGRQAAPAQVSRAAGRGR